MKDCELAELGDGRDQQVGQADRPVLAASRQLCLDLQRTSRGPVLGRPAVRVCELVEQPLMVVVTALNPSSSAVTAQIANAPARASRSSRAATEGLGQRAAALVSIR
jgi:hypothetical protein